MAVAQVVVAPGGLPAALLDRGAAVDRALRVTAPPRSWRVGAMAAYHMGWADARGHVAQAGCGKLLRGALTLWACEALGGAAADALDAAVAVEWMHNFTLVHDDIQDGDRQRRHRPALWTVWGARQGINAGDGLFAVAHAVLTRGGGHPGRRLRAAAAMDRGVLQVIEGQCLDIALEGLTSVSPSTYLRLARLKTGALFGAALEAGALMAGARPLAATAMRRAGVDLGAAFQIRDDWLGTFGDPALTGKPRGADLIRRKTTHVVVSAYDGADPATRRELRSLFRRTDQISTARIAAIVEETGAGQRTAEAARSLAGAAIARAASAGASPDALAEFSDLACFAADREH